MVMFEVSEDSVRRIRQVLPSISVVALAEPEQVTLFITIFKSACAADVRVEISFLISEQSDDVSRNCNCHMRCRAG